MRDLQTRKKLLLTLPPELLSELALWRYRRDFGVDARIHDAAVMDDLATVCLGVSGAEDAVRRTIDSLGRAGSLRVIEDE